MSKDVQQPDGLKNLPAVVDTSDFAVMQVGEEDLREIVMANLGADGVSEFDLDRIKIPAGGGTMWEVPTIEGEEMVPAVEGIIIHFKDVRAYWETSFAESGGGTPPDCYSDDSHFGMGVPGGDCSRCPLAQFGSDKGGRGQACKQMRLLFLLRQDSLLPMVVSLPPTSIGPARKYFLRLASMAQPYYGAVTRIELERAQNQDGIKYSRAKFSVSGILPKEQRAFIRKLAESLRPAFERVTVDSSDYYTDTEGGNA